MSDTYEINLPLLKEVLAVPTTTYRETALIAWLVKYFKRMKWQHHVDRHGNVYVWTGQVAPGEHHLPLVCAHTDSVFDLHPIAVEEVNNILVGYDPAGRRCGLGGDDKAGVFICLELLRLSATPLMGAFFVAEEYGCVGSRAADRSWFDPVAYSLQFDSPCDDILTYTCSGWKLFPDEGEFADIAVPVLKHFGVTNWQRHPYTDSATLKERFDFACLNLPAGYFRFHTPYEYVVPQVVANSVDLGRRLLQELGNRKYRYAADHLSEGTWRPAYEVHGARFHDWAGLERATAAQTMK